MKFDISLRGGFAQLSHQTLAIAIGATICSSSIAAADTLSFVSYKDNTLIENANGERSNGLGDGIFSGRLGNNGGGVRLRAVLAFNLASIPPGSTVTAASLKLVLEMGHGGTQTHSLYRLLSDWGEGTSYDVGGLGAFATANDATWKHTFFPNQFWTTLGGDFVAAASASASVGNSGSTTWSSPGLIADVQYWVNNPGSNFGWIIRGNETTLATAKKFISHDFTGNPNMPLLTVTFTPPPPPPCPADVNQDHTVNVTDLLAVIDAWGACPPPPQGCPADIAPKGGNAAVDVNDLLAVIDQWGPCD